jgi:hypothetical protein
VLELKVRPNVIVVLDSSGSMQWLQNENDQAQSGDHPRSKLYLAKQVLRQIVQNNQEKVSFQMGTYTQYGMGFPDAAVGRNRFQYVVSGTEAPFMTVAGTELRAERAVGDDGASNRGLQSWQIIYPEWGTLYFDEDSDAFGSVDAGGCRATLTGLPKFYARGSDLATELAAAMNAASCTSGSRANSYAVAYNTGTGVFTFSRTGSRYFRIRWADTPNNIRNALAETSASTTSWVTSRSTDGPWILLYRTTGTGSANSLSSPFRDGMDTYWRFTETIDGTNVNFYHVATSRLWNGEVIRVNTNGEVCGMDFAAATTKTNPPSVTLQSADSSCNPGTDQARFVFAGAQESNNSASCNGFRSKSQLIPCDLQSPPEPTQFTKIGPYLDLELPFNTAGDPADWDGDGYADYAEEQDGGWRAGRMTATGWVSGVNVGPSAKASGSTPIANSLVDIKGTANATDTSCVLNGESLYPALDLNNGSATLGRCPEREFTKLWNTGPSTGPWASIPAAQRAIKNHRDPKEKTIVLFVTDGNDTCGSRTGTPSYSTFTGANTQERESRRAAYYAEELYRRLDPLEPTSSVQTYVVGYGGAFSGSDPYLLNLIAWGGSGLGQGLDGQPDVNWQTDSETTLRSARAQCTTCTDAFFAPDAATLAAQLQAIIDQGASSGDFNAQQSITESVFEYVDRVTGSDARMPSDRYKAIVPTRFVSSFTLPGFKGQLKAYQNDGSGNAVQIWSAGDKLWQLVSNGMNTAGCPANTGAGVADLECVLPQLHGGASDSTIATSTAKIKRRIYTTSRNGVYTFNPTTLMADTSVERVTLWPPAAGVLPSDYSSPGPFDAAMGLPPDTPTAFPPTSTDEDCKATSTTPKSYDQCWLDVLQRDHKACVGSNLPTACSTVQPVNTRMRAARREARDVSLAFLAGATTVPAGMGIKRTSAAYQGAPAGSILYKAREWVLGDSELATAAVVTPPSLSEPDATPYVAEYKLFRDGAGDKPRTDSDAMIRQGFGLSQPDDDGATASHTADARAGLKPVMTVVYAPANDMLHAFRAGPSCSPAFTSYSPLTPNSACAEGGGEELWGFVPYDQLEAVRLRAANEPQGRANHVFMLARGVRFADIFVPGAMTNVNIGGETISSMQGVWRRVIYFGRGIGGKYVTALDITAPGPYTTTALSAAPPIPLWSRGNPDTQSGVAGTTPLNGSNYDEAAYARMGETWSMPTVAYVNPDKTNALYTTARRPDGIDFAIFMGSGYGNPNATVREGTTHYTLDALSGDVIAAADVEDVASSYGLTRSLSYPNAIVANSVSFNRSAFTSISAQVFNMNPHPWSFVSARVYVGDIHGRLWKILTAYPDVVLPAADLGADQPVGTAVALLGEDVDPLNHDPATMIPNIFVTSGAEKRAAGPFRNFSLRDDGTDTDPTTTGTRVYSNPSDGSTVTSYLPVDTQFSETFDQGEPMASCGYTTEAVFRGTVQPTSAVECDAPLAGSKCTGNILQRVFFGGTRLSLPNTKYAPPTPLACSTGEYPCRSQFDSILYALGVKTGQAAYDLNASGDDAYVIFRDSRIAAISFQADPDATRGGSRFVADEGLMKSTPPKPPPPPGIPPTTTSATANVILKRDSGQPAPAVQYGSTVCQ